MTIDRRTKMDEELTRLPCCLRTGFPMFVAFSFSSGYKRLSSAMENKPYPRFYGCPHCFSRKPKQYSVLLNVCFISQFICPLFSEISRHLIYVNNYFTILYLQAIFLKHTFFSRLIWLWQRTSMKRNSTMLESLSFQIYCVPIMVLPFHCTDI